jgi:hypothetical protein
MARPLGEHPDAPLFIEVGEDVVVSIDDEGKPVADWLINPEYPIDVERAYGLALRRHRQLALQARAIQTWTREVERARLRAKGIEPAKPEES